jgi:hypothetical protein
MGDNQSPIEISLEIEESDDIAEVFLGYETADGTEYILASVALPASGELRGIPPSSKEEL